MAQQLVLASGSASRTQMLQAAGVAHLVHPARVDEQAIRVAMQAEGAPPRDIADMLAQAKAQAVSRRFPDDLVLGADQILVCEGQIHAKPGSTAALRDQLVALRGRAHQLLSAAVICHQGAPVWRHVGVVRMTMRDFSDAFLDSYIAQCGDDLFATVGGYKLEKHGAQLFTSVQGDYFNVMGLPLLEVLGFLRIRGLCRT